MCVKNITDSILRSDIGDVIDTPTVYGNISEQINNYFIDEIIKSHGNLPDYVIYKVAQSTAFYMNETINFVYTPFNITAKYECIGRPLMYWAVINTYDLGVNYIIIDIDGYRGQISPMLVSSAELSGCMCLCLLLKNEYETKAVFMHAGNTRRTGLNTEELNYRLCQLLWRDLQQIFLSQITLSRQLPDLPEPENKADSVKNLAEHLLNNIPDMAAATLTYNYKSDCFDISDTTRTIHCYGYEADSCIIGGAYCVLNNNLSTGYTEVSIASSGYCYMDDQKHTELQSYCTYPV